MKTIMIDNSLTNCLLDKDVKTAELLAYIESLYELGCGYIEMVTDTFLLLPPDTDKSKIIMRITSEDDLYYVNSFDFPYVLVPAHLAQLAPKITRPVIVELHLRGSTPFDALDLFLKATDMTNVSMIRLVDNFSDNREQMSQMIDSLRKEYVWSFDICPLNKNAMAVSSAIAAYFAGAECVTMCFGSRRKYAEIQDFTLCFSQVFGFIPTPDRIMALCRCNALYHLIFGKNPDSDLDAMRHFQAVPHKAIKADDFIPRNQEVTLHTVATAKNRQDEEFRSTLYKKLVSMRVDGTSAEELTEYIDSYCSRLFKK